MNRLVYISAFAAVMLTVAACSNKKRPMNPQFNIAQPLYEHAVDTTDTTFKDETQPLEEKSSTSVRSSSVPVSRSDEMEQYDNMRGFDPASEDDMDDNGMSRYMENYDEEGWD